MNKNSAIRRSIWLSVAELGLFIVLCAIHAEVVPSQNTQGFMVRLVINFLSGYLALLAGIAATWYVVFTYYLMKSTIEFNRKMSDPFANISWEVSNDEPSLKAEVLLSDGKKARDSTDQQISRTPTEVKWAVLTIGNSRPKPIAKVSFRIGIEGGSYDMSLKPSIASFEDRKLQIVGEQRVKVGIVDLMRYPENVALEMNILSFSYQANDSTESQIEIFGDRKFSFQGFGIVVPRNLSGLTEPDGGTR